MKLYCIADEWTVRGFRLAGIDGTVVTSPAQAVAAMESALAEPDYAALIVTETVADGIRSQVEIIRLTRDRPLVVEIPGPEGPHMEKALGNLVQELAGLSIN